MFQLSFQKKPSKLVASTNPLLLQRHFSGKEIFEVDEFIKNEYSTPFHLSSTI